MSNTVSHNQSLTAKREKLLFAIVHNVHYLQTLHNQNKKKLSAAFQDIDHLKRQNADLEHLNRKLMDESNEMHHF